MEIKKGMRFRCIKDVVMNNKDKGIAYKKGNIYMSEMDNKITDEWKDIRHGWADDNGEVLKDTELYFEKIKEPMKYDLEKTVVHCTTLDEFNEVVGWHIKHHHRWRNGKLPLFNEQLQWNHYKEDSCIQLMDSFIILGIKELEALEDNRFIVLSFDIFERDFLNKDITEQPELSVKNDFKDNKLRWDLLPLDLIEELVKVYDYGAKKYYPESWKGIPDGYQRLKAAALRHLVAFEKGEMNDPESGLSHLACCAWNMLTCLYYAKLKEGNGKERI